MKKDEEAFSMPLRAPAYPQPPYFMHPKSKAVIVIFKTDKKILEFETPEPLSVSPDCLCYAWIGDLSQPPHTQGFYHEGIIAIKVQFDDVTGWYVPYTWVSNDETAFLARELYGLPILLCDYDPMQIEGGQVVGIVRRRSELLMKISFRTTSPPEKYRKENLEDAVRDSLGGKGLQLRKIPSSDPRAKPLRDLVAYDLDEMKFHELWGGTATIEFHSTGAFPHLGRFIPTELLGAYYMVPEWIFTAGKILWTDE